MSLTVTQMTAVMPAAQMLDEAVEAGGPACVPTLRVAPCWLLAGGLEEGGALLLHAAVLSKTSPTKGMATRVNID